MSDKTLLNLGCGKRYHPDWINIDLASRDPNVIAYDLSQGIPFGDGSMDAVYHSHMLEHLRRSDARFCLLECFRVLKPGGVIRIATPDMERIARQYLEKLEKALAGDAANGDDYEWLTIELLDQMTREISGGEMANYLKNNPIPNESFILERIGEEGRSLIEMMHSKTRNSRQRILSANDSFAHRIIRFVRNAPKRFSSLAKRFLLRALLDSRQRRALEIGLFRLSGETHHWLYDRYSLSKLLQETGFCHPIQQKANTSRILHWQEYHLDILADGTIIKPDSIYMEAIKPAS
ncbi:MAG: methyltransferase domain-containing protein [Candidatus Omnitrophota bacterium]